MARSDRRKNKPLADQRGRPERKNKRSPKYEERKGTLSCLSCQRGTERIAIEIDRRAFSRSLIVEMRKTNKQPHEFLMLERSAKLRLVKERLQELIDEFQNIGGDLQFPLLDDEQQKEQLDW